jgi:hypothetical protein
MSEMNRADLVIEQIKVIEELIEGFFYVCPDSCEESLCDARARLQTIRNLLTAEAVEEKEERP